MGGQEVKQTTPQDLIKYLYDLLPIAMSLGMSRDEYWHEEPELLNLYIKVDEINQRKKNSEFWLQGAYIYQALCCASPLFNSLAKDHKPKPYLKQPFSMNAEEERLRKNEKFIKMMMSRVGKKIEGEEVRK